MTQLLIAKLKETAYRVGQCSSPMSKPRELDPQYPIYRGTQREYSSKPLKHSIVERILVFKR